MTNRPLVTGSMSRRGFMMSTGAAAAIVLGGCSSSGTSNASNATGTGGSGGGSLKRGKVANVNLLNNPWTNQMGTAAQEACKVLGLSYTVATFNVDPAVAVTTAESFVSAAVPMMFIQASDGSEIPAVMRAAERGKVYTSDM